MKIHGYYRTSVPNAKEIAARLTCGGWEAQHYSERQAIRGCQGHSGGFRARSRGRSTMNSNEPVRERDQSASRGNRNDAPLPRLRASVDMAPVGKEHGDGLVCL